MPNPRRPKTKTPIGPRFPFPIHGVRRKGVSPEPPWGKRRPRGKLTLPVPPPLDPATHSWEQIKAEEKRALRSLKKSVSKEFPKKQTPKQMKRRGRQSPGMKRLLDSESRKLERQLEFN